MFILLYSEKNEPRSAAAVIGLSRSEAGAALGAAELAALRQSSPSLLGRLASSRPDKGGGIATLHRKCPGHFAVRYPKIYRPISSFRAATRNPEIPARYNSGRTSRASLLHPLPPPEAGPRIGVRVTLSSFRATTRNPGISGHGIPQDTRTVRPYSTHYHLQKLDPASNVG